MYFKNPTKSKQSSHSTLAKSRKIFIGWLHKSGEKYKQVRFKEGGEIRDLLVTEDESISVDALIEKGKKLFFPGGVSKKGFPSSMNCDLGNFSQEIIKCFTDLDGRECDFFTYLKSHGLFASRCYVYLMASEKCESEETISEEGTEHDNLGPVFDLQFKKLLAESTPAPSISKVKPWKHLCTVCNPMGKSLCSDREYEQHNITVLYERFVESSYSDVISRHQCVTRSECYEASYMVDHNLMETPEEYDPLDEGFSVVGIEKDGVCFLQQISLSLDEAGNSRGTYHYPSANEEEKNKLIVHQPNEVWGFDDGELIIGVVSSKPMDDGTTYCMLAERQY